MDSTESPPQLGSVGPIIVHYAPRPHRAGPHRSSARGRTNRQTCWGPDYPGQQANCGTKVASFIYPFWPLAVGFLAAHVPPHRRRQTRYSLLHRRAGKNRTTRPEHDGLIHGAYLAQERCYSPFPTLRVGLVTPFSLASPALGGTPLQAGSVVFVTACAILAAADSIGWMEFSVGTDGSAARCRAPQGCKRRLRCSRQYKVSRDVRRPWAASGARRGTSVTAGRCCDVVGHEYGGRALQLTPSRDARGPCVAGSHVRKLSVQGRHANQTRLAG